MFVATVPVDFSTTRTFGEAPSNHIPSPAFAHPVYTRKPPKDPEEPETPMCPGNEPSPPACEACTAYAYYYGHPPADKTGN